MSDGLTGWVALGGVLPVGTAPAAPLAITTPSDQPGQTQADITSINAAIPNVATTVTLVAPSTIIDIWTSPDAAPLHIDLADAGATTGNAAIYPGSVYRFNTRDNPISAFQIIGDAATGKYNVVAS